MLDIQALIRRGQELRNARANWDTQFQQLAELVLPQMADFTSKREDGARRTEKIFDPTPALAAQKAVSAIAAFAWPSNQRYQQAVCSDASLQKLPAVKRWFDELTHAVFAARYSPRAAFESQMGELGLQSMVFGTGAMFVDEDVKRQSMRYKALHLAGTYFAEDASGRIDTVYRCFNWTVRQIAQRWPDSLPDSIRQKLGRNPEERVEVSHMSGPRDDYDPGRFGSMPFFSAYFLASEKHVLETGGYYTWPFAVHRAITSPGEVYGRSPAWMALSSIRVLNRQKRSILQAAQKIVDPPLLAHEDGVLGAFSQVPGALNMGALDSQGNQLVKPLITGARVDIGLDMMEAEREMIAGAFLMDVFRVLIENPQMTATQTMELLNERATIMAPIVGRYESECFSPLLEREVDLLMRAGQLSPMPDELIEAQGEYKIEYTSPMRKAMRASDAIAITRTLESVIPMAQVDQTVLDTFDLQECARELGEINGMPAKCIRDIEAIKALKDQRAGEAEAAQLLEAAPVVSQSMKNMAQAQAAGGLQPGLVAV